MEPTNKIVTILADNFGLDAGIDHDTPLFSSGLLDSLSSVRLLLLLEQSFEIKVSPLDVEIDDINSVKQIVATVERLN